MGLEAVHGLCEALREKPSSPLESLDVVRSGESHGCGRGVFHPEGAGFRREHARSTDPHLENLLIDGFEPGVETEILVFFDQDVDGSLHLGYLSLNLSDFGRKKRLFALEFQDVISGRTIQGDDHGQGGHREHETRAQ